MATLEQMMASSKYADTIAKPFEDAAKEAQRQREARRDALITMAANRMLPKGQTFEAMGMQIGNKPDPYAEIDMQTKLANLADTKRQTELRGIVKPIEFEPPTGFREVPLADFQKYGTGRKDIVKVPDPNDPTKVRYITSLPLTSTKKATADATKEYRDAMLDFKKDAQSEKESTEGKEIKKVKSILYKTGELVAKDSNFKDVVDRLKAFQNIDVMLEENLGNAKGFVVRQMIIASGDKRPSDKDAKAFGTSPQLFRKLDQKWNEIAKGTFTDFNKDELLQMSELAKGLSYKQARAVIDSKYENYDVNYGDVISSDKSKAAQYRYLDRLAGVSSTADSNMKTSTTLGSGKVIEGLEPL